MAVITVNTKFDTLDPNDGKTSLREALEIANESSGSDRITFGKGVFKPGQSTIELKHGELVIEHTGGDLVIDGDLDNNGTADVTIDGNGQSRVLRVGGSPSVPKEVTLDGLVLTGGNSDYGGAVTLASSELTISNSIITGNEAGSGGAIWAAGALRITDSTLTDNHAVSGGAIRGGYVASIELERVSLDGNTAQQGGAIWIEKAGVSIRESTLTDNHAEQNGGAIYGYIAGASLINSTVSGNSAGNLGGGIWLIDGSVVLIQSTVTDNDAATKGGGVTIGRDTFLTLDNSILAGNAAPQAHDVFLDTGPGYTPPTVLSNGHNIFSQPGIAGAHPGDIIVAPGQVVTSIIAPLADNGGPTPTHALRPGSVAINAGANLDATEEDGTALATDQRGQPRIDDGLVDIGAVESDSNLPIQVIAGDDQATTVLRKPAFMEVLDNDRFVADGPSLLDGPDHGLALLLSDGQFAYFANDGFKGSDSFTYEVLGNHGSTATGTVTLAVKGAPPNAIFGTTGGDVRSGTGQDDVMHGLAGNDTLRGNAGDDLLQGGAGRDWLEGGDGADVLIGGHGVDFLKGGFGADLFVVDQTSGEDVILDFSPGEGDGDQVLLAVSALQLDDGSLDGSRLRLVMVDFTDLQIQADLLDNGAFRAIVQIEGGADLFGYGLEGVLANAITDAIA